jgi:hypothetical protein
LVVRIHVNICHHYFQWGFSTGEYQNHEFGNLHGQIVTYAKYMQLFEDYAIEDAEDLKHNYDTPIFDLKGESVVDLCGGPSSLLLRCKNFSKAIVVDPGDFPDYIANRYKAKGIDWVKMPAEEFVYDKTYDNIFLYNALPHVFDAKLIVENAKKFSRKIRVCESIHAGTDDQHFYDLSQEFLEYLFEQKGIVKDMFEPAPSPRGLHFFGVFKYNE